jgi:hypothetical protein
MPNPRFVIGILSGPVGRGEFAKSVKDLGRFLRTYPKDSQDYILKELDRSGLGFRALYLKHTGSSEILPVADGLS